jgi:hypothetical protein
MQSFDESVKKLMEFTNMELVYATSLLESFSDASNPYEASLNYIINRRSSVLEENNNCPICLEVFRDFITSKCCKYVFTWLL